MYDTVATVSVRRKATDREFSSCLKTGFIKKWSVLLEARESGFIKKWSVTLEARVQKEKVSHPLK